MYGISGLPYIQQVIKDYKFPDANMTSKIQEWFSYFSATGDFYDHEKEVALNSDEKYSESWTRASLQPAKMVCTELANGIFNDGTVFKADAGNEWLQEWLIAKDYQTVCNRTAEWACALGTAAQLLKFDKVSENGAVARDSDVDIIRLDARYIYPIANTEDEVYAVGFVFPTNYNGDPVVQVSICEYDDVWKIHNRWFTRDEDDKNEIKELSAEDMASEIVLGQYPPFALIRPAISNVYAIGSCLGVSVFDAAIPAIELVELGFTNFLNDLEKGQKMVFLDETMLKGKRGKLRLPFRMKSLFVDIDNGIGNGASHIQEYNPSLRAEENYKVLNTALSTLGLRCGFGADHWSFDRTSNAPTTATATMMGRQDLVLTFKRHENSFRRPLQDMLACLMWVKGYDTTCEIVFDDSILQDTDRAREIDRQEVAAGLMPRWKYIEKWQAVDEAEAKTWVTDSLE